MSNIETFLSVTIDILCWSFSKISEYIFLLYLVQISWYTKCIYKH